MSLLFFIVTYFFLGIVITAFMRFHGIPLPSEHRHEIYPTHNSIRECSSCWAGGRTWNALELIGATLMWPIFLVFIVGMFIHFAGVFLTKVRL